MTPCQTFFCEEPPSIATYVLGSSKVHAVDKTLHDREAIIHILKDNLDMAQN